MEQRGEPLPQWYLERPKKRREDVFWLHAFDELSTTRAFGMGPGPIPWTAIREYVDRLGNHDPDFFFVFKACIRALDSEWRDWSEKQREDTESDD